MTLTVTDAIRSLRAVRRYEDRAVPPDVLARILDAGRRAQSSKNDQPWHFVLVTDRDTLRALSTTGRYAGHVADAAAFVALAALEPGHDFDLGQAAAFMELAALEAGVGSCVIAIWEPERAAPMLDLPAGAAFDLGLALGYPLAEPPRPPKSGGRRPLADVVHHDRFGRRWDDV